MPPLMRSCAILALLALAAASCGRERNPLMYDPEAGHAKGWLTDHGSGFSAQPSQCRECHGQGLTGGISGISCFAVAVAGQTCHVGGPGSTVHDPGWIGSHPAAYRANAASCTPCHGGDLRGGSSEVSCYASSWNGIACHSGGPDGFAHEPAWIGTHGAAYRRNAGSCTACHGTDLRGGTSGISCSAASWGGISCHPGGPSEAGHPAGWITTHPSAYRLDTGSCAPCHGADLRGGSSGVSCFLATWGGMRCHAGGPGSGSHPSGWISQHPPAYRADPGSCAPCHGADLRGGASGVSCYAASRGGSACHAAGPGTGGHPASWIADHPAAYRADQGGCALCHGTDLRGGSSGVSCYTASWGGSACHAAGPGTGGHSTGWVLSGHAGAALANIAGCTSCHGGDLRGGTSGVACTQCHIETWQRVHPLSWYPNVRGSHKGYVDRNGTRSCANAWCHGTNLRGVSGSGPSCYSCHGLD